MSDPACEKLEIPERLHTLNRTPDVDFEHSELLYRRIAKGYERKDLIAAFSLDQGESVNRQKWSRYPADVLFNVVNRDHYVGYAVLAFEVRQVQQQLSREQDNTTLTYSFGVAHKPERCMYPHCEIEVRNNGQLVNRVPPAIRRKLRDAIVDSEQRQVLVNQPLPPD